MRIKVASSKEVYEGDSALDIWRQIQQGSEFVRDQTLRDYFDGARLRLTDIKVYLEPPPAMRANDEAYAEWMLREFMRLGRMSETDEPTTAEKQAEAARKKAEADKAKAEAAKKAPAKPAAAAGKPAAATPLQAKANAEARATAEGRPQPGETSDAPAPSATTDPAKKQPTKPGPEPEST